MSEEARCTQCGGFRALPRILHHDEDHPKECDDPFHSEPAPVVEFPGPVEVPQPPAAEAPQPMRSRPVCPHCGCEGSIRGTMTTLGPFKVFAVFCGNNDCRKYLGFFQPLGLEMVPPPGVH